MSKVSQFMLLVLAVIVIVFVFWYVSIDKNQVEENTNTIKDSGGVYVPSLGTGGIDISFKDDINDPNIDSDYKNAINIDMEDLFNVNTLSYFDHYGASFNDPDNIAVNSFTVYSDGSGFVETAYTMSLSPGDTLPGFSEVSDDFDSDLFSMGGTLFDDFTQNV